MYQASFLQLCVTALVISLSQAPDVITFQQKVPDTKFDEATAKTVKVKRVSLIRASNQLLFLKYYAVHIETDREGWELFGQLGGLDDTQKHEVYRAWNKKRTAPKEFAIADADALAKGKAAQKGLQGDGWTLAELIGCTGGVASGVPEGEKPVHSCFDFAWYLLQVAVGRIQCGSVASAPTKYRFVNERYTVECAMKRNAKLDNNGNLQVTVNGVLLTENAFDTIENYDLKKLKKQLKANV